MPTKMKPCSLRVGLMRSQISRSRVGEFGMGGDTAHMHVGAGITFRRDTVDCANRLAVHQNDALVALAHVLQILLGNQRFAVHPLEHFNERGKVLVAICKAENPGTTIAVKRLDDDISELVAKGADGLAVARDQGWRHQVGKFHDQNFFRRVAHGSRVIDDQGLRMNALQQMGIGDITHVKGRVLTQQNHVERSEVRKDFFAKGIMVALYIAHFERLDFGADYATAQLQAIRREMIKLMATRLELPGPGQRSNPRQW